MIPYTLNDLELFDRWGNPEEPLFLDTETCALFNGIRLIQIFQRAWSEVLVYDIQESNIDLLYEKLKNYNVIIHNAAFDLACFVEDLNLQTTPFEKFEDTLLLSRIAFPEKDSFSLDSCFIYAYGYDVYEQFGVDKKVMQKSFLSTKRRDGKVAPLSKEQIVYSCADVYYLPKLWDIVSEYVNTEHYKVDKEFLKNSVVWQRNGLPVDRQKHAELAEYVSKSLLEINTKLPPSLNVNSYIQVRQFLGVHASAKNDLLNYAVEGNDNAGFVLEKRKLLKLQNFLGRYNFENVRGFFAPTTISGRVRCEGCDIPGTDNILQIPRKLKGVFGYGNEDPRYLVYCDYAQLELRTACCNTNEKVIEEVFRQNLDLHAYTAAKMFDNLTYDEAKKDKVKRHAAKTCNFSLLYCGSASSLAAAFLKDGGVKLSPEQAADYRNLWKKTYPSFNQWHQSAIDKFRNGNMLCKTKNGRAYKAKLFTDICGIENQSLGADAAKLALNLFLRKQPEAKVLCFIHDAIIIEAKNLEETKVLGKLLGECMLEAWFEAIKNLPISDLPMPLEVNAGKNLATIESEETVFQTEGLKVKPKAPTHTIFEEKKIESVFKPPEETLGRDILFDADTAFFIAAYENDTFNEALDAVLLYFKHIREIFEPTSLKLFLTYGKDIFRYIIYPQYKANRNREKTPPHLHKIKEYCIREFSNVVTHPLFEADDLIVEAKLKNPSALVFAIDKDVLNSLPGRHYDPRKHNIVEVSENNARFWPYLQAITGDASDGVPGVPGLGKVKAKQFINESMNEKELWQGVVNAFTSKGLTEKDALLSMRLVNMKQLHNGELILFNPK